LDQLINNLSAIVGNEAVLSDPNELLVYECDGLPQHKHLPRAVVFPRSTDETAEIMRVLAKAGVAFTPRGAGTGLSGGALALQRAVVIEFARMRRILKIDETNHLAVVQTGVVNSHVSRAVAHLGLHYVPDPSSQPTCTIGGNIAENAGGVHCLKYGTTTDHVLGVRVVLASGEIVDLGGPEGEQPGYDLRGVFIGSEGTFGIATEATLRLVPIPPMIRTLLGEFAEVSQASHAVSAIIAGGIIPAGLEMMDREIIRAVEASVFAAGLPPDAGAALLIELDGLAAGIDDEAERVKGICLANGARNCRLARDENERKKWWAARKGAFGAIGRIAPDSMIQDAVVPRSRLPEIMDAAYRIAGRYRLRIANVFHAGDGNLHPLICFDSRSADEVTRVKEAGRELMETCVRAGGSITGEHGVGLDKRELLPLIFSENDMEAMLRVRSAFDPTGLMNPGKIIPMLRGCGEASVTQSRIVPSNGRDALHGTEANPTPAVSVRADETQPGRRAAYRPFNSYTARRRLADLAGAENVCLSSVPGQPNVLTVAPASVEEACEIIKLASNDRWSVVPAGCASWIDAGAPLSSINLIVNTRRLNRIIDHEPADLVAISEAGVPFSSLNEQLMREQQWLPLDPPGINSATIGGIVATGASGPQRYGYGPPRAFVIGLKVVLAGGKLIKVGGRVVKNVAGYDLSKLFTASYGTLGLIVEANFKLRPRPELESTVAASGAIKELVNAAQRFVRTPLFPVAVELLSARQAEAIDIDSEKAEAVLLARFAGNKQAVTQQIDTALSILAANHVSNACPVVDDQTLWSQLATSPVETENRVSWRASVPRSEVVTVLQRLNAPEFTSARWQAGVADGRIRLSQDSAPIETEEFLKRLQEIRAECQRLGGSLVIEHGPSRLKQSFDVWGEFGRAGALMQRIKNQLDPMDVFSPGRFGFDAV